jgi:hypothetical protein
MRSAEYGIDRRWDASGYRGIRIQVGSQALVASDQHGRLASQSLVALERIAHPFAAHGHHAVTTRLITEVFKYADQAIAAPNYEPATVRPGPCFCNGLFIGIAVNPGRAGNFMFVVEKNEAAKLHSHPPAFVAAYDTNPAGII